MRRYAAWYGMLMGAGMFGMWGMFFLGGEVPELATAPVELAFHLAAEALAAGVVFAGGVGMLVRRPWGGRAFLLGAGLLSYTLVVSPGYFAQRGEWPLVAMFGVFAAAAVPAIVGGWREAGRIGR